MRAVSRGVVREVLLEEASSKPAGVVSAPKHSARLLGLHPVSPPPPCCSWTLRQRIRRRRRLMIERTCFLSFLLFFSWRNIALQCCVGFCHKTAQIRHNCTYVPPPGASLPFASLSGHRRAQAGLPMFYSNFSWLSILPMVVYI